MRMKCLTVLAAMAMPGPAEASFTVVKGFDNWNAAVGPCTALDFVFPEAQYLTDQYASLGAIFPEGNEVAYMAPGLFQQDGWGVKHYDHDTAGGIDIDLPDRNGFIGWELSAGRWDDAGAVNSRA